MFSSLQHTTLFSLSVVLSFFLHLFHTHIHPHTRAREADSRWRQGIWKLFLVPAKKRKTCIRVLQHDNGNGDDFFPPWNVYIETEKKIIIINVLIYVEKTPLHPVAALYLDGSFGAVAFTRARKLLTECKLKMYFSLRNSNRLRLELYLNWKNARFFLPIYGVFFIYILSFLMNAARDDSE